MSDSPSAKPWERLSDLLEAGDEAGVRACALDLPATDAALTVSRLSEDEQRQLMHILGPEQGAELLEHMSPPQQVEIIEDLPVDEAAAIVDELQSNDQADLLADLDEDDAAAILARMDPEEAQDARRLLDYPEDTAGGVMFTEFVAYASTRTVGEVVDDLRRNAAEYSDYDIQYAYITDAQRLVGVLRLRDLLFVSPDTPVRSIMVSKPLSIPVGASLEDLKGFFEDHAFIGAPVTDPSGHMVGVVRRAMVEEALGERSTEAFLSVSGLIGEEELRTMPIVQRSRRRLAWLSINIVLNIAAASVIAIYQDTLAAVIALAVFLPIISDMSGCSGNQAVAVSIRELTLGLVKPHEFLRIVIKEGVVGLINGFVLGILLGTVAMIWQGNVWLGLVVGTALMLNTLVAVLLGGLVPLVLKGLKQDPALASGPILTTVTDMFGFFMVLSFASAVLPHLT